MVFSEWVNTIFEQSDVNKNSNQKRSSPVYVANELQQGMLLLQNRQRALARLKNKSLLVESFKDADRGESCAASGDGCGERVLTDVNKRELRILSALEGQYQAKLSEYASNYKTFMSNYYRAVENVKKCKANCLNTYPVGSDNYIKKRKGCDYGCDLKGPYVQSCKDTYTRSRISSLTCSSMTSGKCINGNVNLGSGSYVTSSENADNNNVTIKDGCCICGGGAGGPPSVNINAKRVTTCSQVPNALGEGVNSVSQQACQGAYMPSANVSANLYREYANLTAQNAALMKLAQKIFTKIKEMRKIKQNIDKKVTDDDKKLKTQLALYGNVYANILKNSGDDTDRTIDGQVEDILLKEKSQSMHLLLWGSLATLLIVWTIERMSK